MIEVNAALFILLIELTVGLLVALIVILFIWSRKKKRRQKAVAQLVKQIKKQSEVRTRETGSFLKQIYQLEGDELKKAVDVVDKGEKHLFQVLIDGFLTEKPEIITSVDSSVAELIGIYKKLKPKRQEVQTDDASDQDELLQQIEELQRRNEGLKEELKMTNVTMSNMIAEFGDLFSGRSTDNANASSEKNRETQEQK